MDKEALIVAVKKIAVLSKSGDADGAYAGYLALLVDPQLAAQRPEDQRQVLKLMIHAKAAGPKPTPAMLDAHRAALPVLRRLVAAHKEPGDYEMLGMCEVVVGDEPAAKETFRAGLTLERARDPQSTLCGALMRRFSSV